MEKIIPFSTVHSMENDIALLKLADEIQFSQSVMPIRIPLVDQVRKLKINSYINKEQ